VRPDPARVAAVRQHGLLLLLGEALVQHDLVSILMNQFLS
jgi:hypothetical protein